jgi:uncharacterized protein
VIIDIGRIPEGGTRYEGEELPSILELSEEDGVRVNIPVSYDSLVQLVSNEVIVSGRLATSVEQECSRCGDFFSTSVEDSSFLRAYEINPDTEELDITDDIREAVLLQLPVFPVCRKECRGLCAQCGHNLNKGPCGCKPPEDRSAWNVLDGLDL